MLSDVKPVLPAKKEPNLSVPPRNLTRSFHLLRRECSFLFLCPCCHYTFATLSISPSRATRGRSCCARGSIRSRFRLRHLGDHGSLLDQILREPSCGRYGPSTAPNTAGRVGSCCPPAARRACFLTLSDSPLALRIFADIASRLAVLAPGDLQMHIIMRNSLSEAATLPTRSQKDGTEADQSTAPQSSPTSAVSHGTAVLSIKRYVTCSC